MNIKQKVVALVLLIIVLVVVVAISTKAPQAPSTNTQVAPEGSPIIHDIKVNNLTDTSTIVSWKTSIPTKSTLIYGPKNSVDKMEVKDPSLSTAHSIEITPLVSNTLYTFKIVSITEDGKSMTIEGEFTK